MFNLIVVYTSKGKIMRECTMISPFRFCHRSFLGKVEGWGGGGGMTGIGGRGEQDGGGDGRLEGGGGGMRWPYRNPAAERKQTDKS